MTTATVIITNLNSLEDEVKQIRILEAKIAELSELLKEKEAIVKKVMDSAGVEEMNVGAWTVRFTNHVRSGFNRTELKKKLPEVYRAYCNKITNYRKFVIV